METNEHYIKGEQLLTPESVARAVKKAWPRVEGVVDDIVKALQKQHPGIPLSKIRPMASAGLIDALREGHPPLEH